VERYGAKISLNWPVQYVTSTVGLCTSTFDLIEVIATFKVSSYYECCQLCSYSACWQHTFCWSCKWVIQQQPAVTATKLSMHWHQKRQLHLCVSNTWLTTCRRSASTSAKESLDMHEHCCNMKALIIWLPISIWHTYIVHCSNETYSDLFATGRLFDKTILLIQ